MSQTPVVADSSTISKTQDPRFAQFHHWALEVFSFSFDHPGIAHEKLYAVGMTSGFLQMPVF